jgi:glutathione synthase/RimK-type ligase-like ATP-grasp enzyme
MNKKVALITWAGLPRGTESEQLLASRLAALGVDARMANWRDTSLDLSAYDLLVLRSPWDYHLREREFCEWLCSAARQTRVLNSVDTVLWNRNKIYLKELESRGISIGPTCFVPRGRHPTQDDIRVDGWTRVVVKPAVSASAHKTWLFEREDLPLPEALAQLMQGEAFLLQQFIPEIQTRGEISFIYLDGNYSHAVLKRPANGDFRVQKEFGGSAQPYSPPPSLLVQANAIADSVPQVSASLYCRLDAVERNGELILMELELIEPELFLGLAEGAAERFAQAIIARMP